MAVQPAPAAHASDQLGEPLHRVIGQGSFPFQRFGEYLDLPQLFSFSHAKPRPSKDFGNGLHGIAIPPPDLFGELVPAHKIGTLLPFHVFFRRVIPAGKETLHVPAAVLQDGEGLQVVAALEIRRFPVQLLLGYGL